MNLPVHINIDHHGERYGSEDPNPILYCMSLDGYKTNILIVQYKSIVGYSVHSI